LGEGVAEIGFAVVEGTVEWEPWEEKRDEAFLRREKDRLLPYFSF
jgi:hypothetical protein